MKYQPPFVPGATPGAPGIYNANPDASYVNGDPDTATEGSYFPVQAIEHPQRELVAALTTAGITPSHTVLTQLCEAIARYAGGGGYACIDQGTANIYVLSLSGGFVAPKALFHDMHVEFVPAATNTGNCTVNAFGLGTRRLVSPSLAELPPGQILMNRRVEAVYAAQHDVYILCPWSYVEPPADVTGQIQSDWTQAVSSSADFIKNKPAIPAAQIQSDWAQANNAALDFIKNKPGIGGAPKLVNSATIASYSVTDATVGAFGSGGIYDTTHTINVNVNSLTSDADLLSGFAAVTLNVGILLDDATALALNLTMSWLATNSGRTVAVAATELDTSPSYPQGHGAASYGSITLFVPLTAGAGSISLRLVSTATTGTCNTWLAFANVYLDLILPRR